MNIRDHSSIAQARPADEPVLATASGGTGTDLGHSRKSTAILSLLAFLSVTGLVFALFHQCLSIGFLLDDYKHLSITCKVFQGLPSLEDGFRALNEAWTSGTTGQTDGLTSFRPGVTLSFWLCYWACGLSPAGYHALNLLVFAGCAWLVGVMAYQLVANATARGRWLTALCASILFVVYPIHAESVAWVIGRVDLLCAVFYLASLCLYFHYRANGSRLALIGSFSSFLASLSSKEMAVTLPILILAAELFLAEALNWRKLQASMKWFIIGGYFALLCGFLLVRSLYIGTVVGGYGTTSVRSILKSLKNFLNVPTFNKLLFGLNEEQPFPNQIVIAANAAWCMIGLGFLPRLLQLRFSKGSLRLVPCPGYLRVIAFLLVFLCIAQLPTFQLWHIYPNLVGSRLFFLGSSALCILLAVALVPSFRRKTDPVYAMVQPLSSVDSPIPTMARLIQAFSMVALAVLGFAWYQALGHNIFPWMEASRQMQVMRRQLADLARSTPKGKTNVLIDLPQDFSGAGLVGRPELLEQIMSKSISGGNYADKLVTLEGVIPGGRDYICPDLLATVYGDPRRNQVLIWSKSDNRYVPWRSQPWQPPRSLSRTRTGAAERADGEVVIVSTNDKRGDDKLTIVNPRTPRTVWLSKNGELDPFTTAWFEARVKSSIPDIFKYVRLVWRSQNQPKSWIDYTEGPFGPCASCDGERLFFVPQRYRNWVLNGAITELGLQFYPGNYTVEIKSAKGGKASTIMPMIGLRSQTRRLAELKDLVMPTVTRGDRLTVTFDAVKIPGARQVMVFVTRADVALPDSPTNVAQESKQILYQHLIDGVKGAFELPIEAFNEAGKHQVTVLAVDARKLPVGFTSEARTFLRR